MPRGGARAVYDAVSAHYARQFGHELDGKPLDPAVLTALVDLVGTGRSPMPAANGGEE